VENIKKDLRNIVPGDMDWIDLAQDRDQWRALVNTVKNLRVLSNAGKFLSSSTIGDSQVGLSSMSEWKVSSLFSCIDYMLLKLRHDSVTQDHLEEVYNNERKLHDWYI
jgi:hypothetical protein